MGKSTGQITKIIEAEAVRLVDLAERYNKPIVIEKLDTTQSKTGDRYGNKRANRMKRLDIRTHHFYQLYDVDQPKEVL
ncbi:hypothetical protein [Bacillus pseudomycoides]|uniref:hypothetical protein n=1 Tax=Bacillus pseudomycoides TaxID=64104 RepID=UPI00352B8070